MATATTLWLGLLLTLAGALALRRGLHGGLLATLRASAREVGDLDPDAGVVRVAGRVQPRPADEQTVGPVSGERGLLATVTRRPPGADEDERTHRGGDGRTRRVAVPFELGEEDGDATVRVTVTDGPDGPPREVLLTEGARVRVPAGESPPERVAALFPDERTDTDRTFVEARLTAGESVTAVGRVAADEGGERVLDSEAEPFLLTDTAPTRTALARSVRDRRLAYAGGALLSLGVGFLSALL